MTVTGLLLAAALIALTVAFGRRWLLGGAARINRVFAEELPPSGVDAAADEAIAINRQQITEVGDWNDALRVLIEEEGSR